MTTVFVRYCQLGSASDMAPGAPNTISLQLRVLAVNENMWPIAPHPGPPFVLVGPMDSEKDIVKHIKEQMALEYETDEQHVIVVG